MKEEIPDWLAKLQCKTCAKNLVLSVYTENRDEMLLSQLEQENIHNVCLAFANEGIAEIGTFEVSGCEMWVERTPEQQAQRDKVEKRIYDRIFVP